MPLVALTGGIGSGKSTIAARLASHGAVVIDADQLVRELQAPGGEVLENIVAEFGDAVLRSDGTLDRAGLASIVFENADARRRLDGLVHPAVRRVSAERFAAAFAEDPDAVVVYDVPLLAEARADDPWDVVVVAHAPASVRTARLVQHRGMTEEAAASRIAAQASDESRLRLADVVIDTSGAIHETLAAADRLWLQLARGNVSGRT